MSRRPERAAARREPDAERRRDWLPRFVRNVLLLLIPAWALWALLTPFYNRFLLQSSQNLLHLTERPAATQFVRQGADDALISRRDLPPAKSMLARGIRVTDLHFHLVLLGALFLAVPGVPWRRRLENVAWALLIAVFF
ncbi:MAG TPA: hypothetical protein VOA87_14300, partial [Thermoanaerobaculia bacterium]|nr:hypothetical protein [Thermoanaerobaculia bacterium]